VLCGANQWTPLPDPGPQSMASDWRVVMEPLARHACHVCGLVRRWPDAASGEALFASGYGLYAHSPGGDRERSRQAQYAAWIADLVQPPPAQVLDVGCGNGSLLLALAERWPSARLLGCDPSGESVTHGAAIGLRLWQGSAANLPADAVSNLVVSVNVIEHTGDPLAFLRGVRGALAEGGTLALVCPDGGRPGLELLFADHVHSFAPAHLQALCARAGLVVTRSGESPAALGPFQIVLARRGIANTDTSPAVSPLGRARYLAAWSEIDARLLDRVPASAVCFGAGEAAGLLRAYAPRTWARVRACTIDGVVSGRYGALPMVDLAEVNRDETLLVGVRPMDQAAVAARLRARFMRVVTWYDLLDGGGGVW
jgi:SAM-dependent methyltransferase